MHACVHIYFREFLKVFISLGFIKPVLGIKHNTPLFEKNTKGRMRMFLIKISIHLPYIENCH